MQDQSSILPKVTLTVSCPLDLFIWLKQTQRNCSAYIVEAIEARRQREEKEAQVPERT